MWIDPREIGISAGDGCTVHSTAVITDPELVKLGTNVRIDPFVLITGSLSTGSCVQICAHATLGGREGIHLGDWTFVGYGSKLFTASEDYKYLVNEYWGADHVSAGPITLKSYSGVASDVIVMPNVTLKTGTRIGAKSFVYRSPERSWAIYTGNPLEYFGIVDQLETVSQGVRLSP